MFKFNVPSLSYKSFQMDFGCTFRMVNEPELRYMYRFPGNMLSRL